MSADLKDLRSKITPLAWCWIEAEHRATDLDQSEIVREILDKWASTRHRAAIEARKLMQAEGIVGNIGERGGRAVEDDPE